MKKFKIAVILSLSIFGLVACQKVDSSNTKNIWISLTDSNKNPFYIEFTTPRGDYCVALRMYQGSVALQCDFNVKDK